jgi:hypothetical protein
MKHIKLFEEYTDEDLKDLMVDLYGIGHNVVDVDIDHIDYPELAEEEAKQAEFWKSKSIPGTYLKSVSGEISEETTDLDFDFSNGDLANLYFYYEAGPGHVEDYANKDKGIFTLNGKEYDVKEKYLELLESGSVVRACLDLYDGIKSKGESFLKDEAH